MSRLNEQQFGDFGLPDPITAGSVFDKATRAFNGESPGAVQRRMTGQPTQGLSDQDAERRTYGYYNSVNQDMPKIRNPWDDEDRP